jgi:hypothetical protein
MNYLVLVHEKAGGEGRTLLVSGVRHPENVWAKAKAHYGRSAYDWDTAIAVPVCSNPCS